MKLTTRRILITGTLAVGLTASSFAIAQRSQAASTNLFAQVTGSGTLQFGNGVTGTTHIGTGRYEVTFSQNVSTCAYVTTTALNAAQSVQSYTAGGHSSANGVYVEVKNQGGGLTDMGFALQVNCGGTGLYNAVIDTSGALARGTTGTTVTNLGTGRYQVHFASSVASCAYLATVGAADNTLVFNPAGVYTGSSTTAGDVYVETKNPGGGLTAGIPFHLSVVCTTAPNAKALVFNVSGLATRANGGTSSFREATGSVLAVTNRSLAACATIVTRGSVNSAVPFTPATVEFSAGPASNVERITMRSLLFFGGTALNDSAHVAFIC